MRKSGSFLTDQKKNQGKVDVESGTSQNLLSSLDASLAKQPVAHGKILRVSDIVQSDSTNALHQNKSIRNEVVSLHSKDARSQKCR